MNNDFSVVYEYHNSLYVNITNRCPNLCSFCIKVKWNMKYRGYNLKIDNEPSAQYVVSKIDEMFKIKSYNEIVFCGYGEPLMRWDIVQEICKTIRDGKCMNIDKNIRIRINTNGMGNLVNGKNILPQMNGIVDSLNISLNTVDKDKWYKIMRPYEQFKEGAFESVIEFIKDAKKHVKEVVVTAVDLPGVDVFAVESFAKSIGVNFRLRPYLDEYEES